MDDGDIDKQHPNLFDRTDDRYLPILYVVLVDYLSKITKTEVDAFASMREKRNQQSIVEAAKKVHDNHRFVIQTALLESLTVFQLTYLNVCTFSQEHFRPDLKLVKKHFLSDSVESSRKGWTRYHSKDIPFLSAIGQLIHRSRDVSCWLLPHAGLQPLFPNPLSIVSEIERLMEPIPSERTVQAANTIDEFLWQLKAFVESQKFSSAHEAIPIAAGGDHGVPDCNDPVVSKDSNVFRKRNDGFWDIAYQGCDSFVMRDLVGIQYIAALIEARPEYVSATNLMLGRLNPHVTASPSEYSNLNEEEKARQGIQVSKAVDSETRVEADFEDVRQQIREYQIEIEDARRSHNESQEAMLKKEMFDKIREIQNMRSTGGIHIELGAKDEKARKAVYKAIQDSLAAIRSKSEALYKHLDIAIECGYRCRYRSNDSWVL